jgi:thioredoxin reductase
LDERQTFECVIIGLGPAGMAAAVEMAQHFVNIAVIDIQSTPGGQIYRQLPAAFDLQNESFLGVRHAAGRDLIKKFSSSANLIRVFTDTLIWGVADTNELHCMREGRLFRIGFCKLVIAEGARERSIPFPGWTLPGVMTAGGLQKMIITQRLLPGKRFLLAGCGPLQIATAAKILEAGGKVLAIVEASRIVKAFRILPHLIRHRLIAQESISYLLTILRKRVPLLDNYIPVVAKGQEHVEEVTISRLDDQGRPLAGTEKSFHIDILGLGFGVHPASRLTRMFKCAHGYDVNSKSWNPILDEEMRSSMEHVRIVGDSARIGGADIAEIDGAMAGIYIASELGKISVGEKKSRLVMLQAKRAKLESYIRQLNTIFSPSDEWYSQLNDDTIICRCEWVKAKQINEAINCGCRDINEMKKRTRVAMGLCQGGTCEGIVTEMMRQKGIPLHEIGSLHIRPPASPIPLSAFNSC